MPNDTLILNSLTTESDVNKKTKVIKIDFLFAGKCISDQGDKWLEKGVEDS